MLKKIHESENYVVDELIVKLSEKPDANKILLNRFFKDRLFSHGFAYGKSVGKIYCCADLLKNKAC